MSLRIVTWNVNSVRARIDHVKRFVAECAPDVLCLQETKVSDPEFPLSPFRDMGFSHWELAGQKGYHGVATFSKLPLGDVERVDWCGSGEARHLKVTVAGKLELHNFYVPAGGDDPDPKANPKFARKLAFLDKVTKGFSGMKGEENRRPVVLLGDLNIAPLECDVWSHKQLLKVVSHTPVEVEKLAAWQGGLSWIDAMRHFTPAPEPLFTWWSYRARDWKRANRGRRLDHIWVTPALGSALSGLGVHLETRDWERPSDHVPVSVDLNIDLG